MSTVTVVQKNHQIAIASDSLAKWGSEKNSAEYIINHNKILQIDDNYLAITGPQSGYYALESFFQQHAKPVKLSTPLEIYQVWTELQKNLKEHFFLDTKITGEVDAQFECCGMDILIANKAGIFGISSYRDIQQYSKFYAFGSGNEFALGAMYAKYDDSSLSALQIAEIGITAAADFDDATGLPLISYQI